MAKKQSAKKKPRKPKSKPKLVTDEAEPEKVRIGPLDPPPPESGGGSSSSDESQQP